MKTLSIEHVIASPKLPSLPAVAVQIIDLVQDPDVSLARLSNALSQDTALTTKILKTANSAFYARPRAVSKLSEALMILGLRRVKTLALGFSLVEDGYHQHGNFDHMAFWQRSVFAAAGARVMASKARAVDPEEAFLGGMIHSLGSLALNQAIGPEYGVLFARAKGDHAELIAIETETLGFNHAELGGRLGEKWNLPPQLIACLRWFPAPMGAEERLQPLVHCVAAASAAADLFLGAEPAGVLVRYRDECLRAFSIGVVESDQLLGRIEQESAGMRTLLELPEPETLSMSEILHRANTALEELSLEAEQENTALERVNTQLVAEASTDPLTQLPSRRHLIDALEDAVAIAMDSGAPLSYVMADIDHFKLINDTYGHQAGDTVLQAVAATIRSAVRTVDTPGRYGGEEFGIVAVETNLRTAILLAQTLRQAIEGLTIHLNNGTEIRVTASLGVAALNPQWRSPTVQLIAAADAALYQAKAAGRNAVRIAA